ncbi:MAG: ubiquinone biosynthesis regulatory protein kinase UbiB [Gammaproteobacteria bacterium]|nr:ubiquinone biosynthesis regulatory protein kinase UbiB [Gammaproteobacteria bacterium]MCP4090247.1 ubiquinone biosynthesis regulatory protein kinase UbiB [Gammaproteobacteria bacterium]MCP4276336.1 ubiquinone biosynthesis regulatory protein kinase UbiB [Gammaproteobacteria bacterium]MCP4831191.1 ubiquinone biosynthesis regulatory protein kinase UbiB [Gammaproteobacteria bacterium]MCP4930119.1 ubiquinone biosynthesis regulatory protein kinase UbiB [Gammaproteobacteria bacterium]
MKHLRLILRLLVIQRVLVRHGLDELISSTHLFRPVRFLFLLSPWTWGQRSSDESRGVRIREALQELGPVYVKFGQSVSTRQDVLPDDIGEELVKLQDRMPPFSAEEAQAQIQAIYGSPANEIFAEFAPEALAAASIAQVHVARLHSGEEVVVKLLRPGVRKQIERDIQVLYALAGLAKRYWKDARRLRPLEIVAEYEKTILNELDLMREAANASQLRRNFLDSDQLYVPEVYFDYCRTDVMVMERIHGVPVSDMDALRRAGANIPKLAANGVEIFFTQVFKHNFFHADMHPGNIFVDITDPDNPLYAAVDFGIMGMLDEHDRRYLAENFLAFFDHDYNRVARLHVDSGWVPPGTRVEEFESAIRTVCEPIFNKPLKDISFGQILVRLFSIARAFDMEVQPQLVLLQKTLLNIEGLGRQMYPELDLWQTGQPVLREWMVERTGPKAMVKRFKEELPEIRYMLDQLPVAARKILDRLDEPAVAKQPDRLTQQRWARQRYLAFVGALSLLAGVLLIGQQAEPVWLGWALGGFAAVLLYIGRPRP